jgi:hypothetical protein
MSSDRQELIRRFAVAIVQGLHAQPDDGRINWVRVWEEATTMAGAEPQPPADNKIESTQTVSPNAATRLTPDEFHAAVMAYMPWIAERIPQHQRVIQAVRLCAKSPEQAACAIEVAWMDGGVEPQPPADDRIERALQVLRNACDEGDDSFDGWDLVRQGIKILEGGSDD